ncbi:hypothetical protein [Paramicrobacterium chengjingii]|uniref:hypothetical protein n=1 Tax=Paramicrobacterium chengjingii TaxID=2769067 RepID=UPI001AB04504|nr:hypothetical protein [Microbacterium chengjingii]
MKILESEPVPVSIPLVVLEVDADGAVTVTIDGTPLFPEPLAGPWLRSSFAQIIDRATNDRTVPARIEVRENDGTNFTDIIAPQRRPAQPPEPSPQQASPPQLLHTVTSDGFLPGEDIAVAVITGHTDASHTGTARALFDPAQLTADASVGTVEVMLFGRISGTTTIQRLS